MWNNPFVDCMYSTSDRFTTSTLCFDAFFLRLKGVECEGPRDANGLETSLHGTLLESKSHGRSRGTPGLDTDEFSADKCHLLYLLGRDWF